MMLSRKSGPTPLEYANPLDKAREALASGMDPHFAFGVATSPHSTLSTLWAYTVAAHEAGHHDLCQWCVAEWRRWWRGRCLAKRRAERRAVQREATDSLYGPHGEIRDWRQPRDGGVRLHLLEE